MLSTLSNLLALLVALSVSAERLVEIVKNFVPYLRTAQTPANAEAWRKLVLQLLAVAAGVATAFLAKEVLPAPLQNPRHLLLLGLLASGGSGFWTSILGYVNNVKDIKKVKAVGTRVEVAAAVAAVASGTVAHPAAMRNLRATTPTAPQTAASAAADANLAKAIKMANDAL